MKLKLADFVTFLNAISGITSIFFSLHKNYLFSSVFLALAAVFDSFDGEIARVFGSATNFGRELDSLSDVMGSKLKRIDVEFENGEHIIISVLNGSFIAVSTAPKPNLGFIHLILRKYERLIKKISGVGHVNPKEVSKNPG